MKRLYLFLSLFFFCSLFSMEIEEQDTELVTVADVNVMQVNETRIDMKHLVDLITMQKAQLDEQKTEQALILEQLKKLQEGQRRGCATHTFHMVQVAGSVSSTIGLGLVFLFYYMTA